MAARYCRIFGVMLMVLSLAFVVGCSKKKVPASDGGYGAGSMSGGSDMGSMGGPSGGAFGDDAKWKELGLNTEAERREFQERAKGFENDDVYFDYDSYVLSAPAKKVLDGKIAFLKRYAKVKVTVEGHCDERGTNEYNLALGERRANAALQYLKNSGLGNANLSTVSYGEERPLGTGHDEASWAKNRRAHFVVNY
jgi:peptidoglycan-associated lipoprotein